MDALKLKRLLAGLHHRPGIYFGAQDLLFTRLTAFLIGYSCGYHPSCDPDTVPFTDLVPERFHEFVACYYKDPFPGGKGWQTYILQHSDSEESAFHLFFELRDAFESWERQESTKTVESTGTSTDQ